jgi:hypothetical protein
MRHDEVMLATLVHLFTPHHGNNHRPRVVHPEGLVVLTALAFVFHVAIRQLIPMTPLGQVLGYASSITVDRVLEETNAKRSQAGLAPLKVNAKLSQAANAKATHMFDNQYWSHTAPDGTSPWTFIQRAGYKYSIAGENLARDFGDTSSMVQAWMDSPTHKANILQSKYNETGLAVVDGKLDGIETTLVVQMFGASSIVAPAPKKTTVVPSIVPAAQEISTHVATVLSETNVATPIVSPLALSKALYMSMLLILICVFLYDSYIARKKNLIRMTGKNLAHLALLSVVLLVIILRRGGMLL